MIYSERLDDNRRESVRSQGRSLEKNHLELMNAMGNVREAGYGSAAANGDMCVEVSIP